MSAGLLRFTRLRFKYFRIHWQLYLLVVPPLLYILIFKYIPMYGAIIAFKDYNFAKGIWGSPNVGFKHFANFLISPNIGRLLKNTVGLGLYGLAMFPAPIILALAFNEVRSFVFKRTVQLITFAPYFMSTIVVVSMMILFLSPDLGFVNKFSGFLGFPPVNFMGEPGLFKTIYVFSDIWQYAGYAAIIYSAALAGINPELYEAAKMDGASRIRKIMHIDIPGILPVATILLILDCGQFMKIGFEKVFLMQNQLNISASEIISTYVYKVGLVAANFSFGTAVGLFNSVTGLTLLLIVNFIARKVSQSSLW